MATCCPCKKCLPCKKAKVAPAVKPAPGTSIQPNPATFPVEPAAEPPSSNCWKVAWDWLKENENKLFIELDGIVKEESLAGRMEGETSGEVMKDKIPEALKVKRVLVR